MDIQSTVKLCNEILKNANVLDYKNNTTFLCCYVLNKTRLELMLLTSIDIKAHNKIIKLAKKRASGLPLQYIIGYVDFYYNKIYVNKNVLIPRNETEQLCDIVVSELKPNFNVLDLCTGSGCIGLGIKNKFKNCNVTLSDVSKKAIYVAKKNAKQNNLKVKIIKSDLLNSVKGKFDVIVSNPPYIKTKDLEHLSIEVKHEPVLALDGSKDGYAYYKRIIDEVPYFLNNNGRIYFECGVGQAQKIAKYLEKNFDCIKIIKDYYGKSRFVTGVIKS